MGCSGKLGERLEAKPGLQELKEGTELRYFPVPLLLGNLMLQ